MSDREERRLEREAASGDADALERLKQAIKRRRGFDGDRIESWVQAAELAKKKRKALVLVRDDGDVIGRIQRVETVAYPGMSWIRASDGDWDGRLYVSYRSGYGETLVFVGGSGHTGAEVGSGPGWLFAAMAPGTPPRVDTFTAAEIRERRIRWGGR